MLPRGLRRKTISSSLDSMRSARSSDSLEFTVVTKEPVGYLAEPKRIEIDGFDCYSYTFAMPLRDFVKSKVYESAYLFVCRRLPEK